MTKAPANQRKEEVGAAAARTAERKRKPYTRESNVLSRIKRHPFWWGLLALLIAFAPALLLAQARRSSQRSPVSLTKQAALNSLNDLLVDSIYPAEMNQARGLSKGEFSAWSARVNDFETLTDRNLV